MNDLSYLTGHYDAKIKKINDFGAPLNFIFFTDPHNRLNEDWCRKAGLKYELAANAAYSMQYILDRCPDREAGTITETAFDVFSIKDDLVQITRFGAGEDRVGMLGMRK